MQRIEIGRYPEPAEGWAGYIEGTRDDGTTWIMYLDKDSNPTQFYGQREDTGEDIGAVIGEPVLLT